MKDSAKTSYTQVWTYRLNPWHALSAVILLASPVAGLAQAAPLQGTKVVEMYGKLPLSFEVNQGQTNSQVRFISRSLGRSLFLTPDEAVLVLTQADAKPQENLVKRSQEAGDVLRMRLEGANQTPVVTGEETLPGKSHYFVGADKSAWHTDISNYSRVRYHSVYPGIDLVYHGNQRQLEYDFEVSPGANPRTIALGFHGASSLKVDADGNLVIQTGRSTVIQHKPVIYQDIGGTRKAVAGAYRIQGKNQVGFQLASYDHSKQLVIDPTLSYSTFMGGTTGSGNVDSGSGIAVDSSGNVYVTGNTSTNDFPTVNPLQTSNQVPDVFVAKLNATGTALVYSTYLRGSVSNSGTSIAVDAAGNAYVTGYTLGKDFPITANVVQPTLKGIVNAFVTKLSPTGNTLVYSTYLGGSNADYGLGIAVDSNNNTYVTGYTMSADFPTANAVQTTLAGQRNAFVTKLDPLGGSLVYSTYLGGGGVDFGSSIAVDSAGGAYITGQTSSTDFPTVNAFQPSLRGNANAFVVNLHPTGKPIVYSTYLGGSGSDAGRAIAVDSTGHSYITGETSSTDFLAQNKLSGGKDAFVAKLSMDSLGLIYSTLLGGSFNDGGLGIAIDENNNTYVTGYTYSSDFPLVNAIQQPNYSGGQYADAFVAKLDPTGSVLLYSSPLGGSKNDFGRGIAADSKGNAYITGDTTSTDFPTVNPLQPTLHGGIDAFVVKIADTGGGADVAVSMVSADSFVLAGSIIHYTLTIKNNGPVTANSVTFADVLPPNATYMGLGQVPTGWSCNEPPMYGPGTLSCITPSMVAGSSTTFDFKVMVSCVVPHGAQIANTVTASTPGADSVPTNNSATVYVTVNHTPPTIVCPANQSIDAVTAAGATEYFAPTITNSCNATSSCFPASGSLFTIGDTIVTCTATDAVGYQSSCNFNVHVEGASEQLADLIVLAQNVPNSLISKLNDAGTLLSKGNIKGACSDLADFISQVSSQTGKQLTSAQATQLTSAAVQIKTVLNCK